MHSESEYNLVLEKLDIQDLFASYTWMNLTSHQGKWSYYTDSDSFFCYDQMTKGPFRIITTPHHTPYTPIVNVQRFLTQLNSTSSSIKRVHLPYNVHSIPADSNLVVRQSYSTSLTTHPDERWQNLSSTKRQAIKKHNNTFGILDCEPKEFYEFHNRMHASPNSKIQWSLENFEELSKHLMSRNLLYLKKVEIDGNISSAVFLVKNHKVAYYIFGASDSTYKKHESNSALLWDAMVHYQNLDCKEFNFKGSMIPGVAKYFSLMGGTAKDYYSFNTETKLVKVLRKVF